MLHCFCSDSFFPAGGGIITEHHTRNDSIQLNPSPIPPLSTVYQLTHSRIYRQTRRQTTQSCFMCLLSVPCLFTQIIHWHYNRNLPNIWDLYQTRNIAEICEWILLHAVSAIATKTICGQIQSNDDERSWETVGGYQNEEIQVKRWRNKSNWEIAALQYGQSLIFSIWLDDLCINKWTHCMCQLLVHYRCIMCLVVNVYDPRMFSNAFAHR